MAETKLTKKELDDLRARLADGARSSCRPSSPRSRRTRSRPPSPRWSGDVGLDDESADAGTATFEREKDLSIENNVRDLLQKIERALKRIDDGTYGTCDRCGKPIEKAAHQGAAVRRPLHQGRAGAVAPVARWTASAVAARPSSSASAAVVYLLDRVTKLWAETHPRRRADRGDPRRPHPPLHHELRAAPSAWARARRGCSRARRSSCRLVIVVTAFRHRDPLVAVGARPDPRGRARQPHRPGAPRPGALRAGRSTSSTCRSGRSSTSPTRRSWSARSCWRGRRTGRASRDASTETAETADDD